MNNNAIHRIIGTCTYASASSINVASGAALLYTYGDKLSLTQSTGGTKYYYIVGIADTVLTLLSSSIVNNEVITNPYYSHGNMVGHPDKFAYTPTMTASAGTLTTVTASGEYTIRGKYIRIVAKCLITNKGSASANLIFSSPLPNVSTIENVGSGRETAAAGYSVLCYIGASGTAISCYKTSDTSTVITDTHLTQITIEFPYAA
jgi:hypothetical protein